MRLTVEQMKTGWTRCTPARKIHLYHATIAACTLALISTEGPAWCAEYDEWGNLLVMRTRIICSSSSRLPGQQYDEESGLYYNRHRYYDPRGGISLRIRWAEGGWNFYQYPLNPVINVDPQGLVDINLYPKVILSIL